MNSERIAEGSELSTAGVGRLRRTDRRVGQLGAHQGLALELCLPQDDHPLEALFSIQELKPVESFAHELAQTFMSVMNRRLY